ncbi:MAG: hypothetical protein ACK4HW_12245 [Roseinatronobacter sp.]
MTDRVFVLSAALVILTLAGCATSSAVVDGVGGLFIGAGEDIRSIAR